LAERQHGVVTRGQLAALGIPERTIGDWVGRGRLRRLHRGVYAVGHRALKRDGRLLAAALACGASAVLSHRSAGHLWGLLSTPPSLPEVTRRGSHREQDGIVVHRSALALDEVTEVDGIPVTSPFRTVFDLAATLPRQRELERAMNEAEVRQLRDRVSLPVLLERYPRRRGARRVRQLLAAREPGGITRNDFEELFVAFLAEHGLPRPRLNATLALRGRFFEPDCMWRQQRLVVELDGRAVHGTEQAFESDRQRDRILLAEGWRWARVTWRQLRDEPAAIAADLRAALYP
jgi:predicted transcriptional regulator of viral defense system/very-short-patch-repair endonuclease